MIKVELNFSLIPRPTTQSGKIYMGLLATIWIVSLITIFILKMAVYQTSKQVNVILSILDTKLNSFLLRQYNLYILSYIFSNIQFCHNAIKRRNLIPEVDDVETRQQIIDRERREKENFTYFAVLIGSQFLSDLLVWGPYATTTILEVYGYRLNDTSIYICGNVCKTGAIVNPVLNIFLSKMVSIIQFQFQKGLQVFY